MRPFWPSSRIVYMLIDYACMQLGLIARGVRISVYMHSSILPRVACTCLSRFARHSSPTLRSACQVSPLNVLIMIRTCTREAIATFSWQELSRSHVHMARGHRHFTPPHSTMVNPKNRHDLSFSFEPDVTLLTKRVLMRKIVQKIILGVSVF